MKPTTSPVEAKQNIQGILLLNKPKDLTSNAVLQRVKRLFCAKKAGHTGSLDPMATGMLPICFGEATKFCQYLLDADKCYEATALLGIKTDTADAMGTIIAIIDDFSISTAQLQTVLSQFLGSIKQTPSMFSAIKHQGTPLYKFARQGIEIERKARTITIRQLQLNHFDGKQADLTIECTKGTYIRNLVEDIGDCLQTGAHVIRLHRRYTAGFADEKMYTFEELADQSMEQRLHCLLPMERAVNYLPAVILNFEQVLALRQGKVLSDFGDSDCSGCLRLYEKNGEFIGLGEVSEERQLKVKRLLSLAGEKSPI